MPKSIPNRDFFAPAARFAAVGAFVGTAFLVGPLPAAAQSAWSSHHHHANAEAKRETVEERISGLHAALKITADEETNWAGVAQSMRENEANMQKLVAERTAEAPRSSNAVRDLRTYERFAQAHANGLKNLISSFEALYQTMPDTQKVLADQVFQKYGGRGT
jgi:hypothetical protein